MVTDIIRMNGAVLFVEAMLRRVPDMSSRALARDLQRRCADFCHENRIPVPSPQELSQTFCALGFERRKSNGRIFYCGLAYRDDPDYRQARIHPAWRLMQLTQSANPCRTLSVRDFCRLYGLSPNTYYRMKREGRGPRTMRIGRVTRIHVDEAEAWAVRVEREPVRLSG